jgi:membrane protease YdiL (CAAX protease family)
MLENEASHRHEQTPIISLLYIFSVIFLGFALVGPLIGFFLSLPLYPGDMMEYIDALQNIQQHPEIKLSFYVMQGCATLVGLIVGPVIIIQSQRKQMSAYFPANTIYIIPTVIVIATVVAFMGVNSFFIEWNASVHFPPFLKDFEAWAKRSEQAAAEITKFITQFDSVSEFCIAFLVVAVLPAVGEELVFRGLIQNELLRGTKNIHVSIWVAAALFSAIHMQFFGFVPRLLLGAMFGYIYHWSGNLSLAMLAHFINNGLTLVGLYLNQLGYFDMDLESSEFVPMPVVIFSGVLTAVLLFAFKKFYHQKTNLV